MLFQIIYKFSLSTQLILLTSEISKQFIQEREITRDIAVKDL